MDSIPVDLGSNRYLVYIDAKLRNEPQAMSVMPNADACRSWEGRNLPRASPRRTHPKPRPKLYRTVPICQLIRSAENFFDILGPLKSLPLGDLLSRNQYKAQCQ